MSTIVHEHAAVVPAERASIRGADAALFTLRLALGAIFFAHGAKKLFGWFGGGGLDATVQFFRQNLGIPAPLAYLAVFTEFFGGIAMITGILSRLAGLGLAITMLVALWTVHLPNGFFLDMQGAKHGIEYNLALLAMALAVLFAGPGRLALGDWECRMLKR